MRISRFLLSRKHVKMHGFRVTSSAGHVKNEVYERGVIRNIVKMHGFRARISGHHVKMQRFRWSFLDKNALFLDPKLAFRALLPPSGTHFGHFSVPKCTFSTQSGSVLGQNRPFRPPRCHFGTDFGAILIPKGPFWTKKVPKEHFLHPKGSQKGPKRTPKGALGDRFGTILDQFEFKR